jgi:hypothetical protein
MKVPYTFSLIRYVHDPIAGEALNVGVLLASPAASFLDVKLEYRYERFSATFARFDGERFKQVLRHFAGAISDARDTRTTPLLFVANSPSLSTSAEIGRRIWTDLGTSFRVSDSMGGVGENLPTILDDLFERFVTSQYERQQPDHLSDDQVWSRFRGQLSSVVTHNLRPKKFETPDYVIQFDHAFQNERWHVLQPVSMDYSKAALMQDKATKWLGAAMNLQESSEAAKGKFYFLLHPPESLKDRDAYVRSKNILHKIPLQHEIFEEADAAALSEELLSHIRHES